MTQAGLEERIGAVTEQLQMLEVAVKFYQHSHNHHSNPMIGGCHHDQSQHDDHADVQVGVAESNVMLSLASHFDSLEAERCMAKMEMRRVKVIIIIRTITITVIIIRTIIIT